MESALFYDITTGLLSSWHVLRFSTNLIRIMKRIHVGTSNIIFLIPRSEFNAYLKQIKNGIVYSEKMSSCRSSEKSIFC